MYHVNKCVVDEIKFKFCDNASCKYKQFAIADRYFNIDWKLEVLYRGRDNVRDA